MLTCVNEAPRCPFAELFGFVGQRDFHHPWDVPGRGLHTDGVGGDQLERNRENECDQILNILLRGTNVKLSWPFL